MYKIRISLVLLFVGLCNSSNAADVAITIDDPTIAEAPLFSARERDSKIRAALNKAKVKAALFVCGMRVDNPGGAELLKAWDHDGHLLGNHSYSHKSFNSPKIDYDTYAKDFSRGEQIIVKFIHYQKFFRFPYLKEGDSQTKRDQMRSLLSKSDYRNGAVTIDASDWYIDERLSARLMQNPTADVKPYRDFYLRHIWQRAVYYNNLAQKVTGRQIKHTLLVHHSLLNALFLGDLIQMFRDKGWKVIDASKAFQDPVFKLSPSIVPAGESLIWGLAKESGNYEGMLRYPGEDSEYEKDEMDRLGL